MVKLREDYIIRIFPEDLDTLTGDDRLYIKTGDGDYSFYEKMQIQTDDDSITFIHLDRIHTFDYDDIKMFKVKDKDDNPLQLVTGEITGFENFMMGALCGIILMIILLSIGG